MLNQKEFNAFKLLRRTYQSDRKNELRDLRLGNVNDYKYQLPIDKFCLDSDTRKSITAIINQPTVGYQEDMFNIAWTRIYYFYTKKLSELENAYYFEDTDRKIPLEYPVYFDEEYFKQNLFPKDGKEEELVKYRDQMEKASMKLYYPSHLKIKFKQFNFPFDERYSIPLKHFYKSRLLGIEGSVTNIMPRFAYEEKLIKMNEIFGGKMQLKDLNKHIELTYYKNRNSKYELLMKSDCTVALESENLNKFLKIIYKCNNNVYEFHRPFANALKTYPHFLIFQVKCDCGKLMHDYDCKEGLTCFYSFAEIIYAAKPDFHRQSFFQIEHNLNPQYMFPKFKIIVEDWTEKYDAAQGIDRGHGVKKYLKIDFCTMIDNKILFSKILKLAETKQACLNFEHFFKAERNDVIKYLGEKFRVVSVDFHFIADINKTLEYVPAPEKSKEKEFKSELAEAMYKSPMSSFGKQFAKVKLPALYFVYDIETQTNSFGEHFCYMICCEYFLDFPRKNQQNMYARPKMMSFYENIININDDKHLKEVEERVINKFLDSCVDWINIIFRFHKFQIFSYNQFELSQIIETFKDFRLNVRFVGYNNSKYDDKFLTRNDYFNKCFNYHTHKYTERQSIPSEHLITNCQVFNEFKEHISVKFHDSIKFCPEIGSLKSACESLNIELPKIDFDIVKFNKESKLGNIKDNYTVNEFFEIFFKKNRQEDRLGEELWNSIFKLEGSRCIDYPNDGIIAQSLVMDIVLYYCERDVIATRILIRKICDALTTLILKIMNTKRPDGVHTYYQQFRHPFSSKCEKIVHPPTTMDDAPMIETLPFKIEETSLCDPFDYLSVAQISMSFVKALYLGRYKKLNDNNPRLAEIVRTHIRPSYFGGFTGFNVVGFYRNVPIGYYDIKSSYPLGMTAVMPIITEEIGYKYDLTGEDYVLLQSKIDKAKLKWLEAYENHSLHDYHVFSYINFHANLLVDLFPPKNPRHTIGLSPVHFPELLCNNVRQLRYLIVPQRCVRNSVQIGTAILCGWDVKLCRHKNDIVFNCLRKRNKREEDPYRCKFPLSTHLINSNCDDWLDPQNEEGQLFKPLVKLLGDTKAEAAESGNEVVKKLSKMLLNASAGRLGMREKARYTETFKIFDEEGNHTLTNDKLWKTDLSQNIIEVAQIIVAYGHYNLFRSIILVELANLYNDKPFWENTPINLYNDTDSIIVDDSKLLPEVRNWIESNESKEIGCWDGKNEFRVTWGCKTKKAKKKANALFVVAKKSYMVLNEVEPEKFKNNMTHSKGINVMNFSNYFNKEDGDVDQEKIYKFIKDGGYTFKYDYIKKDIEQSDYIQKTFTNATQEKLIQMVKLGVQKDEFMAENSFLPKIEQSEQLSFTHHPCCYDNCPYCKDWFFRNRQQIQGKCELNQDLVNVGFK
jgi:hypothetical protein